MGLFHRTFERWMQGLTRRTRLLAKLAIARLRLQVLYVEMTALDWSGVAMKRRYAQALTQHGAGAWEHTWAALWDMRKAEAGVLQKQAEEKAVSEDIQQLRALLAV
jgi:hypothetical protein